MELLFYASSLHPDITPFGRFMFGLIVYGPALLLLLAPFGFLAWSLQRDASHKPQPRPAAQPTLEGPPPRREGALSRRTRGALLTPICLIAIIAVQPPPSGRAHFDFLVGNGWFLTLCALLGPQMIYWQWPPRGDQDANACRVWLLVVFSLSLAGWFYNTAWLFA